MRRSRALVSKLGRAAVVCASAALALAQTPNPVLAAEQPTVEGGVTYTNISAGDGAGISYRRTPSPTMPLVLAALQSLPVPISTFLGVIRTGSPLHDRGNPGVVVFDYDNDGDQDIYVTNGPGTPNSLYQNQYRQTGSVTFIDRAASAGVMATAQNGAATCAADIDNDGDQDLYVTGTNDFNILYRNNGNGTFTDITDAVTAGDKRHPSGCTFADVNNDGKVDLYIGNTYDGWEIREPVFRIGPNYDFMEHNQLFVNLDGRHFSDASDTSGVKNVSNMNQPGDTGAGFTWAVGAADYDLDGDIDIFSIDNQGSTARNQAERRGWNRLFVNDGTGFYNDVTPSVGLDLDGSWMGVGFADFNCDGYMDFFSTNLGSYQGFAHSRWFFGSATGQWTPNVVTEANGFGFGTSVLDWDNDGDTDTVYYGGDDMLNFVTGDNPGSIYLNTGDCSGDMRYAPGVITFDHRQRPVLGSASGDFNNDGFDDLVSVTPFEYIIDPANYRPSFIVTGPQPGPINDLARFQNVVSGQVIPGQAVWVSPNLERPNGTLAVEMNSANNGNRWVQFKTRGSIGTLSNGKVNRDGIGAVLLFTPEGGKTSMRVVSGGESHASRNSLIIGFGLGGKEEGSLDILWPGGVRNRLNEVEGGESLTIPEIPCSYTADWANRGQFQSCLEHAVNDLRKKGIISNRDKSRFIHSNIEAYLELHPDSDDDSDSDSH